jgi:DNA-binding SARP family transcriptional activator/tetratricopeptide (TPR) repeat protein
MPTTTRQDPHRAGPPGSARTGGAEVGSPATSADATKTVDVREARSVLSAVTDHVPRATGSRPGSSRKGGHEGHALVGVGSGIPGPLLLGGRAAVFGVNSLPVHGAKIHRPPLRADVLSRPRLNGWLEEAARGRLALIVAEAGFGKTTLLADWARHTRRLIAWYRLEPDDRDWLTFIRHLVGGGRELDPDFAPETYALLLQMGPGGPTQAELVASLVREYAAYAAASPTGLSLLFDDYQSVDACEETEPIVRALLERTGHGFSIIIATRSTPTLPLGRLRARSAVSRLEGDALNFDVPETDQLFRDAYRQPLDPDVVVDLVARTEGWAALLSLVHTNLEESRASNPRDARGLVRELSGARGHLYEYLAEEVVSTLPGDLRAFLIRVSVLQQVDTRSASIVDAREPSEIALLLRQAEDLGLLTRPDAAVAHCFHPLVREFLLSRLESEVGESGVLQMHRRLAANLESVDWYASVYHYRAAGDAEAASLVIDGSVEEILASGRFDDVRGFLDGSAGNPDRAESLTLRSRVEFARGQLDRAVELADLAITVASDTFRGTAMLNLVSMLGVAGIPEVALRVATDALERELTPSQRHIAHATVSMSEAAREGDLLAIADELRLLAAQQEREGHLRYAWISRLNLSYVLLWAGDPREALRLARQCRAFQDVSMPDVEKAALAGALGTALAYLGDLAQARSVIEETAAAAGVAARNEAFLELAKVLVDFGGLEEAKSALEHVSRTTISGGFASVWTLISGALALREGDSDTTGRMLETLDTTPCTDVAGRLRVQLLRTRHALWIDSANTSDHARELLRIATRQRSRPGIVLAGILEQLASDGDLGAAITQLVPDESSCLSIVAEDLASHLPRLRADARDIVERECRARPERWRTALRLAVQRDPANRTAVALLVDVGDRQDLAALRSITPGHPAIRGFAAALAHRLALPAVIQDLGVVSLSLGGRITDRPVRRKVLAFLCFLASRPNMVASRDETLDALWPDLGPEAAANSLHQTIYFLRRVIEPDFKEGLGAKYVLFDGEVVSLNPDLFDSTSRMCWRLIVEGRRSGVSIGRKLLETYKGRFAVDFLYEEWATDYRDHLHAAVLSLIEAEIWTALAEADHEHAIDLAQRALSVDPGADAVELALLRAYKSSDRHAAASEQYAHYASVMRDQLGVDPPPFDDL